MDRRDGLSHRDGALRQIGGKAHGVAIVPRAHGSGQLRRLGRDRLQFERPFAAQQDANQPRPQQQAETVGQRLDHSGNIGAAVQYVGHVGQNLGPALLFSGKTSRSSAGSFAEARGFKQAAQLSREGSCLGSNLFSEKVIIGVMQ